jgi:hypothetical protein
VTVRGGWAARTARPPAAAQLSVVDRPRRAASDTARAAGANRRTASASPATAPNRFGLDAFYSLHAWMWKPNPAGTFAMWNPRVSCPGGGFAGPHLHPGHVI